MSTATYRAKGDGLKIAIYASHYIMIQRHYASGEWCRVERYPYDAELDTPAIVTRALQSDWHTITGAQFAFALEEACMQINTQISKPSYK